MADEQRIQASRGRGFALVDGDIEILTLVYELRFARTDNLILLAGRSYKKINGRLSKLVEHGYLRCTKLPLQKYIYSLGTAALPVLVEQGTAPLELIDQRIRTHELKELFLKHEMMIVDVHTMLRAAGTGAITVVAWREGKDLYDTVEVPDGRMRRALPVRPDAFFTLEDADRPPEQNRISFFLEADRSTTSHARFEEKLVAYWHYLGQELHTKKYGIRTFRVLTVAITPERARNLCALAAKTLPSQAYKFFLFGSAGKRSFSLDSPAAILDAVFLTPRDPSGRETVPLVPRRVLASAPIHG